MNLRNMTIWTTGLLMLVPLVMPVVFMFPSWGVEDVEDLINVPILCWLFSGTPLLCSLVLAKKLKYRISTVILLFTTIIYGISFVAMSLHVYSAISAGGCGCGVIRLFLVGPLSLPVMIPAWMTAILLDNHYATKTPDPGTAASTPSSPAPWGGESEVK